MCRKVIFVFALSLGCAVVLRAQTNGNEELPRGHVLEARVVDGDTIPVVTLPGTLVFSYREGRSKRFRRRWNKMMSKVLKVYPYAEVAGDLMKEYDRDLRRIDGRARREAYIDQAEAALKAEFEKDIRHMSISEGVVLIKLIDRETGHTSYQLIKELKSGFTAFMWQTVARFFGTNLKEGYHPLENSRDAIIEEIVVMIEEGRIPVVKRGAKTPAAYRILQQRQKRLHTRAVNGLSG